MKNFILKLLTVAFMLCFTVSVEAKKTDAQKDKIKFVNGGVQHIKDRHWHNANPAQNTSRFNQSMTVEKLNKLATKTISKGTTTDSKQGQGRKVHEKRFEKPIGQTTGGDKAHTLRVVTNPRGEVITSFPVR